MTQTELFPSDDHQEEPSRFAIGDTVSFRRRYNSRNIIHGTVVGHATHHGEPCLSVETPFNGRRFVLERLAVKA